MVIEAGVQPTVTAALARDRDRALGRHPRRAAPRPAQPAASRPCGRRAPWSAPIRAPRSTSSPTARSRWPQRRETTDPRVRWVGVGRGSQNVGITNLLGAQELRRRVRLPGVRLAGELLAPRPQTFDFSLEVDGKPHRREAGDARAERAALGGAAVQPQRRRHGHGAAATSTTTSPSDNTAYAVLPPPRKIAVTLVSPGNLFLEKVLQTDPQVALDVKTPDQYQGGMGEADVVVLDSVTPPEGRPGPLRLRQHGAAGRAARGARAGSSARRSWTGTAAHPVMRHVEFAKVAIEDAMRIRPLAAGRPLVEAVGGPLIYALEEPDRKAHLRRLRPVQDRLPAAGRVPADPLQHAALAAPGRARPVEPAARGRAADPAAGRRTASRTATVTTPSGRAVKAPVTRGVVSFTETDEVGLYTLSTARGETCASRST